MATIKEIAILAGVSRGTVDRVLNHRGSVNPKTEEKIWEIAQALDYKPNKAGIVLAAQKRKLKIGVILLGLNNPFYDDVLRGISEKAVELESYNCTVLIKQTEYSLEEQLHRVRLPDERSLRRRGVRHGHLRYGRSDRRICRLGQ